MKASAITKSTTKVPCTQEFTKSEINHLSEENTPAGKFWIGVACISFFPLVYLVGKFVTSIL